MTQHRCDTCADRGYWTFHKRIDGSDYAYRYPCKDCQGKPPAISMDKELRFYYNWFMGYTPPTTPIVLTIPHPPFGIETKRIEDPALFWSGIKNEFKSRNVYALELRRRELKALHERFGVDEF